MKPLAKRDPFRVGIVAIAALAVLALGVVLLSVSQFGKREYTAVLAQTAGLRVGEDVTVHGVPQGEVTSIELRGSEVLVGFSVADDQQLGRLTSAEVKVATLLGSHYLEVTPAGGGDLADGRIPLSRTSVPFNLQDVLEQGTEAVQELDPVKIAQALAQMSRTFDATNAQLGPALVGITRLSQVVSDREGQTDRLLSAAQRTLDQLTTSSGDLMGLMHQANLVVSEITRRRQAIHTLLTQTTELSDNLSAITSETRADLGPAFVQLNAVLHTLRQEDRSLKHLLEITAPALRYVANATGSGPWVNLWTYPPGLPPDDVCQRTGGAGCP